MRKFIDRRTEMKKFFHGFILAGLVLLVFFLGFSAYGAPSKAANVKTAAPSVKPPQYGGTVTFSRAITPIAWDNADWTYKHANDTGFYMEHLMMGDLQKGPRGANQFAFHTSSWIPPESVSMSVACFIKWTSGK